jgi:hypothetical protein
MEEYLRPQPQGAEELTLDEKIEAIDAWIEDRGGARSDSRPSGMRGLGPTPPPVTTSAHERREVRQTFINNHMVPEGRKLLEDRQISRRGWLSRVVR